MSETHSALEPVRVVQMLCLLSVACVILALAVAVATGAAQSYEISIYSAYPWYLWVSIILTFVFAAASLVLEASLKRGSRWMAISFAALIISNCLFLLLPVLRGYFALGFFDNLSHIGRVIDILSSGHVPAENFYPGFHIIVLTLHFTTGLNIPGLILAFPAGMFSFYSLSMYLLCRELGFSRRQLALSIPLATIPLLSTLQPVFLPRTMTFFLAPFALLLSFRVGKNTWKTSSYVPLILLFAALCVLHMEIAMIIAVMLGAMSLSLWVCERVGAVKRIGEIGRNLQRSFYRQALLLFIFSLVWFWASSRFSLEVNNMWSAFVLGNLSEGDLFALYLSRAGVTTYETIEIFLKTNGCLLILFCVSVVFSARIWLKVLQRQETSPHVRQLAAFSSTFLMFGGLSIIALFLPYIVEYYRLLFLAILGSTVLNAACLAGLFNKQARKIGALIIVLLVASSVICTFNVYPSPWIDGANQQVTKADMAGVAWFIRANDKSLLVTSITFTQFDHAAALLGVSGVPDNMKGVDQAGLANVLGPSHFGYDKYTTAGASYSQDAYLLSTSLDRIYYTERIPEFVQGWRWTPDDFQHLNEDPTVNIVCSSSEFQVFYIQGTE